MSYILDALKRSEQERHQDKMPSFSAENMIIQTNQKKAHWWPFVLILVLILNAIILFIYKSDIFNPNNEPLATNPHRSHDVQTDIPSVKIASPTVNEINKRRAPPSNVIEKRNYIKPIKQAPQNGVSTRWQDTDSTALRTDDHLYGTTVDDGLLIKPRIKTLPPKTQAPSAEYSQKIENEALIKITPSSLPEGPRVSPPSETTKPTFAETPSKHLAISVDPFISIPLLMDLDLGFQKTIPALAFNSHIYSDNPSQRRVMINNLYLKEGQSFEGLALVEIGESFIKVNKKGIDFKLPVLRDWDRK